MSETSWQTDLDEERLAALKPYRVEDSQHTINEIYDKINTDMYLFYGPDYDRGGRKKLVVEPPQRYDDLIRELLDIPGMRLTTCRDMLKIRPDKSQVICNIRHDVDGDLRAALQQAEIEARYGAQTTFYVLHTSNYYGTMVNDVHVRNAATLHAYKEIQDLGHEIALHTDPMHLYQELQMDGGQALVDNLNWLRDHGLNVTGSTAHNCISVYGANNYAIFKGRPCEQFYENSNRGIIHNGKWAPLQVLDEKELGLECEANDVFWQADVPVEYGCLMKHDGWHIEHNKHGQLPSTPPEKRGCVTAEWMDQNELVDHARTMDKGCYLLLAVHPMFYGLRHDQTSAPTERLSRTTRIVNKEIGWVTLEPKSLEAHCGDRDGRQEFQSVAITNKLGMLDKPGPHVPITGAEDEIRVLLLGRDNLHGADICIPAQVPTKLETHFELKLNRTLRAFKLAAPGMGFTRYYTWLKSQLKVIKPHFVVLGIGADEAECSDPAHWGAITGFNPAYPPGLHIWQKNNTVTETASTPLYWLHETNKTSERGKYSLTQENSGLKDATEFMHLLNGLKTAMAHVVSAVRDAGAKPIFLIEECGERCGLYGGGRSQSERVQGHNTFRGYCKSWLPEDVPVADPYDRFLTMTSANAEPGGIPFLHANGEWNMRGHRIAADILVEIFKRRGP